MFLCCCCWLLNDEENIRRGKEEAEEPEFQNSFGIRNSSVCVCVCVCLVFLATLLLRCCCCSCCYAAWQSENLCRTPLKKVKHEQKKHKKLESVISHNTTHRNSNPFQSRQQINKSQYVIEIFSAVAFAQQFSSNTFLWLFFPHTSLFDHAYLCVRVCVLLFLISIMISRRSFHSSQFQFEFLSFAPFSFRTRNRKQN